MYIEKMRSVLGLSERLKAFRFNKSTASRALILKVDPQRKLVIPDGDEIEDVNVEELRDELPERQPRFVILAYRLYICDVNTNQCFLPISPQTTNISEMVLMNLLKLHRLM